MDPTAPPRPVLSPGKRRLFRVVILAVIGLVGVVGAEAILRKQQTSIAQSNRMAPGMVKYDPELGWRLVPNWSGAHSHRDFAVQYSINAQGLRADTPAPPRNSGRKLTLALGDSYTFGFGVNDDETYVHRLNAAAAGGFDYVNGGVPGYSPDQEAVFLAKELWALAPQRVLLLVYLGNDLLDIMRDVPLQLRTPKPRFEAVGDDLFLRNVPVPKSSEARVEPWWPVVLGADASAWSWRTRLELRYELFRVLSPPFPPERDYRPELASRFGSAVSLFERIAKGVAGDAARRKAEFIVIPIASAAYFHSPRSPSAQYQDFFCEQIVQRLRTVGIPVIHLPALMRERYHSDSGRWFFPHEGHLNPDGHKVVAEILARELSAPVSRG